MSRSSKINILFEDYDSNDIDSVIKTLGDIKIIKNKLDEQSERLKDKVLDFLKKNSWERYYSEENKINVSVIIKSKEVVNKKLLNLLLNEEQQSQIIIKKKMKDLVLITPEDRKKLKEVGGVFKNKKK